MRRILGTQVDSKERLHQDVMAAIFLDHVEVPITRQGFAQICTALQRKCSARHTIECMLFCRGQKMDASASFDYDRMLTYLHKEFHGM